ncbi:MAG TPA: RluA family pseudouridine synthase [Armatimonadota bacterium]|jgi:23S rRNA pseudouridine1911/1915/1917 synthase
MNEIQTAIVPEGCPAQRLDVFLAALIEGSSRSAAQRIIRNGLATVNGKVAKSKDAVQAGDIVAFTAPDAVTPTAQPEDLPLEILFEDDSLLVVNKGQGMTTHPAPGSPGGTLVNALLGRGVSLSEGGSALRPGIVHRLDKDTSGLLVVAKNASAHIFLARQLADRTLSRRYITIIWGVPRWLHARVDAPIGRHATNRQKMSVVPMGEGRASITDLDVLEPLGAFALVRARLQSGRTHQIRVHAAYSGHPVLGDRLYGGERRGQVKLLPPEASEAIARLPGQALHAAHLAFVHPVSNERMSFTSAPPAEFLSVLSALGSGFTVDSLLDAVRAEPSSESVLTSASGR